MSMSVGFGVNNIIGYVDFFYFFNGLYIFLKEVGISEGDVVEDVFFLLER